MKTSIKTDIVNDYIEAQRKGGSLDTPEFRELSLGFYNVARQDIARAIMTRQIIPNPSPMPNFWELMEGIQD